MTPEPPEVAAYHERMQQLRDELAAEAGIPPELLQGPTSSEAFTAATAPRKQQYSRARDRARSRWAPVFEELDRLTHELDP